MQFYVITHVLLVNHQFVLSGDPGHHGGFSGARHRELQLSGQGQILRDDVFFDVFRLRFFNSSKVQMPSEVLQMFSPSHVEMGCHLEGCKAGNEAVFANILQFSI